MEIPQGRFLGSYKALAPTFAAAAGTGVFALLEGAANKIVKLKKIKVSGLVLTDVGYLNVVARKYSTAATGGTAAALDEVPLSSAFPAAGAVGKSYTAAPTAGTAVGAVAAMTVMGQDATAAATGLPATVEFDFAGEEPVLLSAIEGVGLAFAAAPATAVTVSVEFFWDEYSN